MSTKQEYKKVGGNWVETTDPNTGKKYYANVVTKEVSWTFPSAEIKEDMRKEGSQTPRESSKEDVWLERQDPSGRVYYFNPAKRETSWHRPEKIISSGALQSAGDRNGEWVARQDPRSGRTYYYNATLRQTSWTNPDEEAAQAALKANQGAVKRLSVNLAAGAQDAGKRLSTGLKRMSQALTGGATAGMNRNSARYSIGLPQTPVNKTEARMSIKLGGDINYGEEGRLSFRGENGEDPFAALKALKNQGIMPENDQEKQKELEKYLKINLDDMCRGITDDIKSTTSFRVYASENFNTRQKVKLVGGGGQLDLGKMTMWQGTNIKQPLHLMSDKNMNYDALLAFKNILFFCGDKNSKKLMEFHAQIFLATGAASSDELHDELICQLIKQANNNPGTKSLQRVWMLTAMSCGSFKCSKSFLPYLESHLKSGAEASHDDEVKKYARYAMLKLKKAWEHEPRLEVPCYDEILSIMEYQPYSIAVSLVNSTVINMDVDSWSTIADVNHAIAYRLNIEDGIPFTCFEMNEDDMERVLDDDDRILDVLAYWDREVTSKQTKRYTPEYRFLYKLRLFFDISEEDTSAVELAYYQAVFDVNDSRYPCTEEDAIILASLEAQEKFGDYDGSDVFGENVGAYVPAKYYNEETKDELKRKIYDQYQQLAGYDSFACKVNYLDYVKAWKYYGSAYYFAEPITNKIFGKEFPKEVVLGVNAKGVLIIDPGTLDLLQEFPYSEIVTWGFSAKNLVFVVGNLVRSRKMFFETEEGVEINSLIYAYVNKLMTVGDNMIKDEGAGDMDM